MLDDVALVEHLVGGILGACVMCRASSCAWLDLIAANLAPVADSTGALTDHVALHERCISTLREHWANLSAQGGPAESSDPRDDSDRSDDGDVHDGDVLDGPATPFSPPMAPIGIYAQG
ncbi:MAG: hypothetical protein H7Y15_08500 [Pseudonocardia sp.]|nr:hypothetical protein [Pseudonocardia sp.]